MRSKGYVWWLFLLPDREGLIRKGQQKRVVSFIQIHEIGLNSGTELIYLNPATNNKWTGQLKAMLKTCYKKAISKDTLYELLNECGLKTYDRSGKTTGIMYENQKYRFNKFGFTNDRFNELEQTRHRENEIGSLRESKKGLEIEKGLID